MIITSGRNTLMTPDACYFTPPVYAKRIGVKPETVIGWIISGELRAFNVARHDATRPRYRIPTDAIMAFEANRTVVQAPTKSVRRRKQQEDVTSYF